jgi:phospholipase C
MTISDKIKRVVVLMLENRSFDHLLGYLRGADPRIDGLLGTEFNYVAPSQQDSQKILVSNDAPYVPDLDPGPGHSASDVHEQLFAACVDPDLKNQGFVVNYSTQAGVTAEQARTIMRCFAQSHLPVLTTLATEFAICDHWFSSLPGPTTPNRLFAHCATSGGFVDDNFRQYRMTTIFERLSDVKLDCWRIYYHDPPNSLILANLRNFRYKRFFESFSAFQRDCRNGTLPWYSFIEPRYFSVLGSVANDQHPPNGILAGEKLIADVYNSLRASPQWQESLLLIVWDEHGGFYDHVFPPATVNPDGEVNPGCSFESLGVRVPAVIVSPWIARGTVDDTVYDHTSIPATLKTIFKTRDHLTRRDAQANTFDGLCSQETPRLDAPAQLAPSHASVVDSIHAVAQSAGAQFRSPTDLQRSFVQLANELDPETAKTPDSFRTELEAAYHVHRAASRFFLS